VSGHRHEPVSTENRLTPVPCGCSARALPKALACVFAVLFSAACRRAQIPPSCPAGAKLMGEQPPKGFEVWCQKSVDGRPVKDGPFIDYATNGDRMIQGTYLDGVQNGEWMLWYENGVPASIDHYVNGLQSGLHTSWYANGQKALEGEYQRGKREGVWTQWDPTGLRSHKTIYKAGKIIE
jgi:hypothetical protein